MPCNSITTNTVELENVKDMDLLKKALKAEFPGGIVHARKSADLIFQADGRECTISGGAVYSTHGRAALEAITSRVKQSYAREAVALAAKRFGWAVVKGADANHFQLVKR